MNEYILPVDLLDSTFQVNSEIEIPLNAISKINNGDIIYILQTRTPARFVGKAQKQQDGTIVITQIFSDLIKLQMIEQFPSCKNISKDGLVELNYLQELLFDQFDSYSEVKVSTLWQAVIVYLFPNVQLKAKDIIESVDRAGLYPLTTLNSLEGTLITHTNSEGKSANPIVFERENFGVYYYRLFDNWEESAYQHNPNQLQEVYQMILFQNLSSVPIKPNQIVSKLKVSLRYDTAIQGGIRDSVANKVVLLFSEKKRQEKGNENPYEDNYDESTGRLVYTGTGKSGDQSFSGNPGYKNGRIRDHKLENYNLMFFQELEKYGGIELFQYIGDFEYIDHKMVNSENRKVIKFELHKIDNSQIYSFGISESQLNSIHETEIKQMSDKELKRVKIISNKIVRDTKESIIVKEMYDYKCQICDIVLVTAKGDYSEGAHIRPLGNNHGGRDHHSNILSLCPNDHILLDTGSLKIDDDGKIYDFNNNIVGKLTIHEDHNINKENFQYHESNIFQFSKSEK